MMLTISAYAEVTLRRIDLASWERVMKAIQADGDYLPAGSVTVGNDTMYPFAYMKAFQGDARCQAIMGLMHRIGIGEIQAGVDVPRDDILAHAWLKIALTNKNLPKGLERLVSKQRSIMGVSFSGEEHGRSKELVKEIMEYMEKGIIPPYNSVSSGWTFFNSLNENTKPRVDYWINDSKLLNQALVAYYNAHKTVPKKIQQLNSFIKENNLPYELKLLKRIERVRLKKDRITYKVFYDGVEIWGEASLNIDLSTRSNDAN